MAVPTHLLVFVITTWLLAMLPGAGQALMFRQTLQGGLRLARASIAGNATGLVVWSTAAAAGLSAVLLADARAYALIRLIGGIVLVLLGINTIRGARQATDAWPGDTGERRMGLWSAYCAGLATNLGNPKAGVFAVSILPQFITPGGATLPSSVVLGLVWAFVNASWHLLFTWALNRGRELVSKAAVRQGISITTGVVLLVLGVAVASGL